MREITVGDIVRSGFFHGDVDMCDDLDERAWIAYCGDRLTDEGEKKFAEVLDLPCWFNVSNNTLIVHCETAREADTLKRMLLLMAGICTAEDWAKWVL